MDMGSPLGVIHNTVNDILSNGILSDFSWNEVYVSKMSLLWDILKSYTLLSKVILHYTKIFLQQT